MKKIIASLLFCLFVINSFAIGINMDEAKTIQSDRIEYDVKTESLKAKGNTEIINASGQQIKLTDADFKKESKDLKAQNIELWLGQNVYVRAKSIIHNMSETIAKHAMFTACDKCDEYGNAWEIYSKKIVHDSEEKMLYFHNATFWVYNDNIPVLWLPYYEMPDPSVKYKTGFLDPSFNSTNKMGTQINIPFYINFSDRHDLTTTFSYLTKENPLLQAEHRLNMTHSEFRTKGSFTRNKEGENRWHLFNDDIIEMGENARTTIYVQRTSDKTYLQKYGFYSYQPYLDSGAKLELFGQNSYIVADTHDFQELREPSRNQTFVSGNILPNIRGTYQTDPFFKETFLSISGDVLAVSGDKTDSQRIIGETRIISPWTLWGGNRLTASVATRYDIYNFENVAVYNNNEISQSYTGLKTRFLPSAYIEWGLPLYDAQENWTYILEPKARLTIMQHSNKDAVFAVSNDSAGHFLSDTTLFSNNRFAGLDVWENGDFIDYGVHWAAFNTKHSFDVFIGQTYDINTQDKENSDFNENGFRNGFSDYVGRITYSIPGFNISSRFRFDRDNYALRHSENSVYTGWHGYYFTLGHIWDSEPIDIYSSKTKDTHEAQIGAGLPITKRLKLTGNVIYNAEEHKIQRRTAGIFYEHPCYFWSLSFNRDNAIRNDYEGNTTYQFKFGISINGTHY
ncbi:MAG: LPS-assembly protein LptD [Alphaproteobacteria bacterium]|nr:LPS-assembly protein LptD [Alphaproteobacteria bacterium]